MVRPELIIYAPLLIPSFSALRGEFLRTRARALRYREEIIFLEEEQRRSLVSLEQYAVQWEKRGEAPLRVVTCSDLREGMSAYAAKQAALRRALAAKFRSIWATPPKAKAKADARKAKAAAERRQNSTGGIVPSYDSDEEEQPASLQDDSDVE